MINITTNIQKRIYILSKNSIANDGHLNVCKICDNKRAAQNYQDNQDERKWAGKIRRSTKINK